jgi:hypothetical protein
MADYSRYQVVTEALCCRVAATTSHLMTIREIARRRRGWPPVAGKRWPAKTARSRALREEGRLQEL